VPSSAVAVGFFVNSIADDVDLAPGNGVCATGTGACTLRAAIQEANVLSGVHSIFLPSGTYTLTIPGGSEDFAATGDLDIRASMTITGAGAIIDGGGLDRVLHVIAGSVNISGVTIRNGRSPGFGGGGIRNDATLRLSNSVLSGNSGSGNGGGLRNAGSATLTNVTVSGNASGSNGAGIFNEGTLSVTDGTIRDNVSGGVSGEGFWNNGGTATLSRVTVSGNGSTGILNSAALTLVNVTISGNAREGLRNDSFFGSTGSATLTNVTVTGNGGAANVVVTQGTVTLKNTLLAGPGPNCSGPVASQGHNLDSGNTCGLAGSGDLVNTNPMLGPLAANTGFTLTHALLPGSPAIDAGDDAGCPATDQRGIRRPVDGDGNTLRVCDIGAYEQATAFKVFIVTTTADGVDASPLDGVCATATGVCTLRAAIQQANAVTGATPAITIVLPAGTYVLTIPGAAEDAAATGDLDITQTVLITGAEAATTIVAGGGLDRVFEIHPAGLPVQIEQVTVRGGSADSGPG
jgi:CSLREA domain-containing protein